MAFVRTWLMPRVAFWLIWTFWLWCLQSFLLARLEALPGHWALLYIVAPPVLIAWIGSKLAKNPLESPNALFWKGAALSCLLAAFANMFLRKEMGWGLHVPVGAALLCGYLGLRGPGVKKVAITQGELFDRAQFIAQRSSVWVKRVVVFKSPRDLPAAFAQRNTGAILLSDRLLRLLSRRETEAVMAHEAAHLLPSQRMVLSAVPMLVALTILLGSFWPEAKTFTPFLPILTLLLWRALRRMQEYEADSSAVRATGDPEALIAALTRISSATGMPLHWGLAAGLFLPHPPMTARFRSIAGKGGIASARVDQLVAAASVVPPLPGFASPFAQPQSVDDGVLSVHRERLAKRMVVLSRSFPILAGAAFAAVERALTPDALTLIALTVAWSAGAMVVFWLLYEVVVGSERRRLRSQLPDAHRRGSYFAGVSTAAEPRYYEGLYHHDLGLVRIEEGALSFAGTRCSFSLGSSEARRVWLASGPRHWTPRKIVCVEYQLDGGKTGVVSLQPLERWFWPGTSAAAQELFAALTQWSKNGEPPSPQTSTPGPPPQISGLVVPRVGLGAVWKSMRVSCLVSLCVGWLIVQIPSLELEGLLTPFAAPLVTGALILFILAPHVEWSQVRSAQSASTQPPAFPEAE
jgi:Zn-dependent protease with chaperone function